MQTPKPHIFPSRSKVTFSLYGKPEFQKHIRRKGRFREAIFMTDFRSLQCNHIITRVVTEPPKLTPILCPSYSGSKQSMCLSVKFAMHSIYKTNIDTCFVVYKKEMGSSGRLGASQLVELNFVDGLPLLSYRHQQTCHMIRITRIRYGFWPFFK